MKFISFNVNGIKSMTQKLKNGEKKGSATNNVIKSLMEEQKPDVLCLQEVKTQSEGDLAWLKTHFKNVYTNFSKMKKGIRIMNAARGGVIDEEALLDALDNGTVSFAALDVYNNEPNPNQKLISHPKIACTPHIGAATLEAQDRIGEELADLITEKFGKH